MSKEGGPEQEKNVNERESFMPFEIAEEYRQIYFAGSREEVLALIARFAALLDHPANPDRQLSEEGTCRGHSEKYADRFFEELEKFEESRKEGSLRRSRPSPLQITQQPYRFYVWPEAQRSFPITTMIGVPEDSMKHFGVTPDNKMWVAMLCENSVPHDEERKVKQWKQLTEVFMQVRGELKSANEELDEFDQ